MHDDCTHDCEMNENYEEMKRKRLWELKPLLDRVGDSSRWILDAWRRPSAFFTFFFFKEAQGWLLGFLLSKLKMP